MRDGNLREGAAGEVAPEVGRVLVRVLFAKRNAAVDSIDHTRLTTFD